MLFLDPVTLLEVDFLASPLAPGKSCLQFDSGLILLCVSLGEVIDTSFTLLLSRPAWSRYCTYWQEAGGRVVGWGGCLGPQRGLDLLAGPPGPAYAIEAC